MRSVILSAGRSCFTVCPGCYNHFGRTASETAQILAFVARTRTSFGLRKITVGGGAPLTRPDIVPLLAGLRAQGLKIHLDTVGTAFLGSTQIRFMGSGTVDHVSAADVAPLTDLIGIPLDGSTDTVQQRFRRHVTVASQQAVLTCLDEAGAHVCVNTVVHAGNADDMANIAGRLDDHPGVREWQLFQFMPIGPLGHRNRDRYLVSDDDFHRAADTARTRAPRGITVTVKSARQRKHRYLLIDSAGLVWTPDQASTATWLSEDSNDRRKLIGNITDADIIERLATAEKTTARVIS
ncbi:radical SAM protein [Streptomyces sp. NPDC049881]|uniref:radical SAM protein n=1 Tax=Streptomyces sp. NPDC049881 TaxID=3155778 RepID=UPI00342A8D4A